MGWPLSSYLETHFGWRVACFTWAALHICVGLPLNALLPTAASTPVEAAQTPPEPTRPEQSNLRASFVLAWVFAVTWFVSTAMAAHLPRLIQAIGAPLGTAVLVGALIGPAQVGARLLEFGLLNRLHPLLSAQIAAALHPIGVLMLFVFGAPASIAFGLLHGAGNGILTIAKGLV